MGAAGWFGVSMAETSQVLELISRIATYVPVRTYCKYMKLQ
jgi:hypothetical protein